MFFPAIATDMFQSCTVFHIFILLHHTILFSTLIGWHLSVLINDMLCYVIIHRW